MLHRKIYKKYYPVKNKYDLQDMNHNELTTLSHWVGRITKDIQIRNIEKARRNARIGVKNVDILRLNISKPPLETKNKLQNNSITLLDEEDLIIINLALELHKYSILAEE